MEEETKQEEVVEESNELPQFVTTPRQIKFWDHYLKPKSSTFGNRYQSGLLAGYTDSSARVIGEQNWYINKMRKLGLLTKAEKVLDKTLTMDTTDIMGQEKADLLRVQADTAKFVAKTLGKDEGYSERTELTGKEGNPIIFMPAELMDKYGLSAPEVEEQNKGF